MIRGATKRMAILSIAVVSTVLLSTIGYSVHSGALDPPVVSFTSPAGAEILPNTPTTISFDRWMDHASVERAFKVEPPIAGSFEWEGNTLRFVPKDGWERGVAYKVTIGTEAQSFFRQPLRSPVSFNFVAAGPFAVKSVQPAPGATEVGTDSSVLVQFNHPVVPLGTLTSQSDQEPLTITPAVEGKGKWLNTSTYLVRASKPLNPSTRYQVTVRKGIKDTTGSELGEDYRWSFTTIAPAVADTSPGPDTALAAINGGIQVTFNQPMDQASVEARFEFREDGGGNVQGKVTWPAPDTLVFTPTASLKPGTGYVGKVGAGALGAGGQVGTAAEYAWRFTTAPKPEVTAAGPASGQGSAPVPLTFSSPMDIESLRKNTTVTPNVDSLSVSPTGDATRVILYASFKPSTRYTIAIAAGTLSRDGQALAQPYSYSFTTPPLPPSVKLVTKGNVGTFSAYLVPEVYVNYVNISRLDWGLYKLDESAFLNLARDYQVYSKYKPDQPALRTWATTKLDAGQNVAGLVSTELTADGQPLAPGFYYLQVSAPESGLDRQLLMVSKTSLTLKRSDQEVLIWAVDQSTGKPVADLPLRVLGNDGAELATGKTGADGVYAGPAPSTAPTSVKGGSSPTLFVVARSATDVAAASTDWSTGIEGWGFGFPTQLGNPPYKVEVYTDRPIYRTDQKVYFKGTVRLDDDVKYSLPPAGTQVETTLFDGNGRQVQTATVTLNDFGSFDGEFQIAAGGALGYYRLSVRLGSPPNQWGSDTSFQVAEYRKPEYQVSVTTNQQEYVQGDRIAVNLQASYFFGGPVAGAKVTWRVTSRDYNFRLAGNDWYSFFDADLLENRKPSGGLRAQGTGVTDAEGKFAFEIPVDVSQDPLSQVFTVEASVQDVNNQEVSARTDVVAHKSALYLGLRPTRYVGQTGESQAIELISVDKDGKPIPSTAVVATVLLRKWSTVREKLPTGGYRWVSTHEDTEVAKQNVTTDATGKAKFSFTPQAGGSYWVVVRSRDSAGNEARSAAGVWVSDRQYVGWRVENNDRLNLVADKKLYEVGDTAKVLIPSPFPQATALLTVERGHILSRRVLQLDTNSPVIEVPIEAGYLPNVYVSVVLVNVPDAQSPPSFKLGYAELSVSTADKQLNVTVTPDKSRYEPQDTANYTVKTTDHAGHPVSAELSFALVDASVLSLADDRTQPAIELFYGRRPLGVMSASTLAVSMDRISADTAAMGKGVGDGMSELPQGVRADFRDTAYWNPTVKTDANGTAKVAVKLPDNLTTWRARVRGLTADTLVGSAESDIVTSKTLLVRPITPRFFTAGDQSALQAIVQNQSTAPVEVEVSFQGKGVEPQDTKDYKVYKITVPAGGNQKVGWPVRVGQAGEASLLFSAKPTSGSLKADAVGLTLPIQPPATAEVTATAGEVTDQITEKVVAPASVDRSLGELTVNVASSLAAGMKYSSQYLEEYPYECTEQTISRFLPRILISRAFSKLGLPDKDGLAAELPSIISRSLQRLYKGQHGDGGWGWWSDDQSDPWMTAYALLGLTEAKNSGVTVDPGAIRRAQDFLRRYLSAKPDAENENLNLRAFVLYTMARSGQGDVGLVNSLFDRRQGLSYYGQAHLALAMMELGANPKADSKLQGLLSNLTTAVKTSATGAHWEESTVDYWTLNTNTRTTAIVLNALVRLAPDDALVPQAVRWLMTARKEGHWETTQDTAWSLMALTDYLAASGELQAVTINGRPLGGGKVTKENVDQTNTLVAELKDLLVGENNVLLGRLHPEKGQTGQGKMYYTMQFKYYLPSDQIAAESQGVYVFREYLQPDDTDTAIDSAKAGDLVKVRLTIVAPEDLHYLVVEDPIPAGTEAVDTRLKTTSITATAQTGGITKEQPGMQFPAWLPPDKTRRAWYFNQIDVRDTQVAVFATYLPRGTYEYTYLLRATTPGTYQAQPTRAAEMYFPEVWGRSAGAKFTVSD